MGTEETSHTKSRAAIEPGVVRLSNRWMERRWSTFTGATTELHLGPAGGDCLTRKSPEYHVDYGDRPLAVTDIGDVSWSDHSDARGASIALEQAGPGISLRLETFMPHGQPGIVRQLSLTNTGAEAVQVTRLAPEILPLKPRRFRVLTQDEVVAPLGTRSVCYRALRDGEQTIWFGGLQSGGFALFTPNPAYCAVVWTGSYTLAPGKTWKAPPAFFFVAMGGCAPDTAPAMLEAFHQPWLDDTDRRDSTAP